MGKFQIAIQVCYAYLSGIILSLCTSVQMATDLRLQLMVGTLPPSAAHKTTRITPGSCHTVAKRNRDRADRCYNREDSTLAGI